MAGDFVSGDLSKRLALLGLGDSHLWIRVNKEGKGEVVQFFGRTPGGSEVGLQSPADQLDRLPKDCFERDNQVHCKRGEDQRAAGLTRNVKRMLGVARDVMTLAEQVKSTRLAVLAKPSPDNYSPALLDPTDRILETIRIERPAGLSSMVPSATFLYRYLVDTNGDQTADVTLVAMEIYSQGRSGQEKQVILVRLPEVAPSVVVEVPQQFKLKAPSKPAPGPERAEGRGCGCSLGSLP